MIGWIPCVLVKFLDEVAGPGAREAILADAGLTLDASDFRMDTDLPDPACRRVIEAACARLGLTEADALDAFAPFFLRAARATFPGFFRGVTDTRTFLLRQPGIHNSLAAGLRDTQRRAVASKFRVEALPGGLRLHYNSPNRLAALYAAVARELALSFGERVAVRFESGGPSDARCTLIVTVLAAAGAGTAEAAMEAA